MRWSNSIVGLRLECETYVSDYNPVAVLILKAVLEYPQKYGEKLVEDVKKRGEWVLKDKAEHMYVFPDFTLEPGTTVRTHTGSSWDAKTNLCWYGEKMSLRE